MNEERSEENHSFGVQHGKKGKSLGVSNKHENRGERNRLHMGH